MEEIDYIGGDIEKWKLEGYTDKEVADRLHVMYNKCIKLLQDIIVKNMTIEQKLDIVNKLNESK